MIQFLEHNKRSVMITELNVETWPKMRKTELAEKLADRIEAEFSK